MLTNSNVLEFIKLGLGYPFTEVELADKDIIHRAKEIVLKRYFSTYVPVYKSMIINCADLNVQTSESNKFKIIDPDNAGILTVVDVINDNEVIMTNSIMGSQGVSYSELPSWYSDYNAKRTQYLTTNWYTIFEFIHPMYIQIRPKMTVGDRFMVIYEAQHVKFESVPTYREVLFLDLALAYIKLNIAQIRSKYQSLGTQFGEIKLNWDTIKSDGKELWDATMEKLEAIPPFVTIDIG